MGIKDIKNIIFDLGGVILNIDYNKTATAYKELGLTNFDDLYSQFKQNNLFDRLETGLISEDDFVSKIKQELPLGTTNQQIINAWNAMLLDLPEQRINLLRAVSKQYRIFLLSNTNQIHYDVYMAYFNRAYQLKFNTLFEKTYYSHKIGLRKPNKDCFEFVLESSSLNNTETLFIDDSSQHIQAAKILGINTLHHTERDLTELFDEKGKLLNVLT